jgi:hypothetical protein
MDRVSRDAAPWTARWDGCNMVIFSSVVCYKKQGMASGTYADVVGIACIVM